MYISCCLCIIFHVGYARISRRKGSFQWNMGLNVLPSLSPGRSYVMAGRTYPAMEADGDRRPIPWSATMPNLEYTSTYSGAHSDITPASHHALSTAYDDLKKRYNDLQGKYTQVGNLRVFSLECFYNNCFLQDTHAGLKSL